MRTTIIGCSENEYKSKERRGISEQQRKRKRKVEATSGGRENCIERKALLSKITRNQRHGDTRKELEMATQ
jgi:hypothetical protein